MTWLVVAGGFVAVAVLIAWASARVGRNRDPYAALGSVEGHREIRITNSRSEDR